MTTKMKNVIIRSLSGLVYIAVIVGALLLGSPWMLALTLLLTLLAVDEFNRNVNHQDPLHPSLRILDLMTSCIPPIVIYALFKCDFLSEAAVGFSLSAGYILYNMFRLILPLYIKGSNQLTHTAYSFMAQFYIVWPLTLMLLSYMMMPHIVMLMFIMIWLNDTGAFCVGSLLGRHKLFERISPKKSWEGFLGGVIFAVAAGIVAGLCLNGSYFNHIPVLGLGAFGLTVAIMATWGDLVESLIKRTLGVKDSGHLLPGHGGILDRIDSLLLVAPATLLFLITYTIFQ